MPALNVVQKFFPQVTKVIDSTSNAAIEVTEKDATSSKRSKHSECAMAVACKRKFKLDGVIISRSVAYLIKGKQARRFMLPPSVEREVTSFDRGGGFAPGKYELSKVPKMSKLGARVDRDLDKGRPRRDGEPKKFRHITTGVRGVLGGEKEKA